MFGGGAGFASRSADPPYAAHDANPATPIAIDMATITIALRCELPRTACTHARARSMRLASIRAGGSIF